MVIKNNSLLCNKFGGIKRISSSFSDSFISASDMQNVELFDTGVNSGVGIRTMKGNSVLFEFNQDEKIINIFQSVQNTVNYCFVHVEDETKGKIYLFNMNSSQKTLKVDNLSLTGKSCAVDFAQGWSDLFIFSNGEELLSIELGNLDTHGQPDEVVMMNPVDVDGNSIKGLGLTVFDGRLWIFDENRLYYSVQENCYDFNTSSQGIYTSAGFIEFVKDITAITPYIGSLAVFHKDSSCLLSINDDYSYSKSNESPGGCAGMNALVFHGSYLYFYDDTKKSIFAFSQIINGETTLVDNIAKDVQDELFNSYSNNLDNIKMISIVQAQHNEIWMISSNNSQYSTILIFDYYHGQWIKRKSQKLNSVAVVNQNILSASQNKILEEYNGNDFDGEFIKAFYTCSPFNLNADNVVKILYIPPRLTLDISESNHFMICYAKDYDSVNKVKHKKIAAKNIKNLFVWDNSAWDGFCVWKPNETNSIKRLPISTFKTLEITFYTEQVDNNQEPQGFAIKNIEFSKIKLKQL